MENQHHLQTIIFSEKFKGRAGCLCQLISPLASELVLKDLARTQLCTCAPCCPHSHLSFGPRPPSSVAGSGGVGSNRPPWVPLHTASKVNSHIPAGMPQPTGLPGWKVLTSEQPDHHSRPCPGRVLPAPSAQEGGAVSYLSVSAGWQDRKGLVHSGQ